MKLLTRGVGSTFARAAVLAVLAVPVLANGCGELGAPGANSEAQSDDGSQRGELAIYVVDGVNGQSDLRYMLRAPSGQEHRLLFDRNVRELNLEPGTEIKVWGSDSPDGLHVTSVRAVSPSPDEVKRSALINGTPYNARSFAFVLVDLGGGFNPKVDEAAVLGRMISSPDSIRNYYLSDSYGRQDITTQVFGPIKYTLNGCATNGSSSGPGQLAADLRPMIPGTFQHYLWYFGTFQSVCQGWSGLASLGTPDKPSKDTWFNASSGCTVLVQEPGHNFGMQHSSSLACPGASLLDNPAMCTVSEYGDGYDPMGSGCRHMNAWQKAYQGWFGGCNGVTVTSSGTFTLLPLENRCDGAQFLKVKAAKARQFVRPEAGGGTSTTETLAYYYVELRTPVDFDALLGGNRKELAPQILIHAADDVRTRAQKGLHTFLLDMTPTTAGSRAFDDAALPLGATFTDPAGGVRITATAIGMNQATITVEIEGGTGGPTCLDGTAFPSPGPGPDSCGMGSGAGGASASGSGGAGGTSSGGAPGQGGRGGAGGRSGVGGRAAAGASGAAGRTGSGGTTSTGGQPDTGSGGAVSTGGSGNGTGGGTTNSGGVQGSGGASASGGRPGTGGGEASGTGGERAPTGSGGAGVGPSEVTGEINCAVAGDGAASWPGGGPWLTSLVVGLAIRSRRRRR